MTAIKSINKNCFLFILLFFPLASVLHAQEQSAYDKAHQAVAEILFEYEEGPESFASYRVNRNGFVDIIFAKNMPDRIYSKILNQLQSHPDIKGVLPDRGGPVCGLWH